MAERRKYGTFDPNYMKESLRYFTNSYGSVLNFVHKLHEGVGTILRSFTDQVLVISTPIKDEVPKALQDLLYFILRAATAKEKFHIKYMDILQNLSQRMFSYNAPLETQQKLAVKEFNAIKKEVNLKKAEKATKTKEKEVEKKQKKLDKLTTKLAENNAKRKTFKEFEKTRKKLVIAESRLESKKECRDLKIKKFKEETNALRLKVEDTLGTITNSVKSDLKEERLTELKHRKKFREKFPPQRASKLLSKTSVDEIVQHRLQKFMRGYPVEIKREKEAMKEKSVNENSENDVPTDKVNFINSEGSVISGNTDNDVLSTEMETKIEILTPAGEIELGLHKEPLAEAWATPVSQLPNRHRAGSNSVDGDDSEADNHTVVSSVPSIEEYQAAVAQKRAQHLRSLFGVESTLQKSPEENTESKDKKKQGKPKISLMKRVFSKISKVKQKGNNKKLENPSKTKNNKKPENSSKTKKTEKTGIFSKTLKKLKGKSPEGKLDSKQKKMKEPDEVEKMEDPKPDRFDRFRSKPEKPQGKNEPVSGKLKKDRKHSDIFFTETSGKKFKFDLEEGIKRLKEENRSREARLNKATKKSLKKGKQKAALQKGSQQEIPDSKEKQKSKRSKEDMNELKAAEKTKDEQKQKDKVSKKDEQVDSMMKTDIMFDEEGEYDEATSKLIGEKTGARPKTRKKSDAQKLKPPSMLESQVLKDIEQELEVESKSPRHEQNDSVKKSPTSLRAFQERAFLVSEREAAKDLRRHTEDSVEETVNKKHLQLLNEKEGKGTSKVKKTVSAKDSGLKNNYDSWDTSSESLFTDIPGAKKMSETTKPVVRDELHDAIEDILADEILESKTSKTKVTAKIPDSDNSWDMSSEEYKVRKASKRYEDQGIKSGNGIVCKKGKEQTSVKAKKQYKDNSWDTSSLDDLLESLEPTKKDIPAAKQNGKPKKPTLCDELHDDIEDILTDEVRVKKTSKTKTTPKIPDSDNSWDMSSEEYKIKKARKRFEDQGIKSSSKSLPKKKSSESMPRGDMRNTIGNVEGNGTACTKGKEKTSVKAKKPYKDNSWDSSSLEDLLDSLDPKKTDDKEKTQGTSVKKNQEKPSDPLWEAIEDIFGDEIPLDDVQDSVKHVDEKTKVQKQKNVTQGTEKSWVTPSNEDYLDFETKKTNDEEKKEDTLVKGKLGMPASDVPLEIAQDVRGKETPVDNKKATSDLVTSSNVLQQSDAAKGNLEHKAEPSSPVKEAKKVRFTESPPEIHQISDSTDPSKNVKSLRKTIAARKARSRIIKHIEKKLGERALKGANKSVKEADKSVEKDGTGTSPPHPSQYRETNRPTTTIAKSDTSEDTTQESINNKLDSCTLSDISTDFDDTPPPTPVPDLVKSVEEKETTKSVDKDLKKLKKSVKKSEIQDKSDEIDHPNRVDSNKLSNVQEQNKNDEQMKSRSRRRKAITAEKITAKERVSSEDTTPVSIIDKLDSHTLSDISTDFDDVPQPTLIPDLKAKSIREEEARKKSDRKKIEKPDKDFRKMELDKKVDDADQRPISNGEKLDKVNGRSDVSGKRVKTKEEKHTVQTKVSDEFQSKSEAGDLPSQTPDVNLVKCVEVKETTKSVLKDTKKLKKGVKKSEIQDKSDELDHQNMVDMNKLSDAQKQNKNGEQVKSQSRQPKAVTSETIIAKERVSSEDTTPVSINDKLDSHTLSDISTDFDDVPQPTSILDLKAKSIREEKARKKRDQKKLEKPDKDFRKTEPDNKVDDADHRPVSDGKNLDKVDGRSDVSDKRVKTKKEKHTEQRQASDELQTKYKRRKKIDKQKVSLEDGASKQGKTDESKKRERKVTLVDTGEQSIKEAGSDARLTSFDETVKPDTSFDQVIKKPSVIQKKTDQAYDELQAKRKTKKTDKKKASVDDGASKSAKTDETEKNKEKITLIDTGEQSIQNAVSESRLTSFDETVKPDTSFEQVIEKPSVIREKTDQASDELQTKRKTKKMDKKKASVDNGASKSAKTDETKKKQGKITLKDSVEQSIKEAGSDAKLTSFDEPVKRDSSFEQVIEKPSVIREKTDQASDELQTKRKTKKMDEKKASVHNGASKSAKSDETKKKQGKITLADTGEQSIKEAGSDARLTSFDEPLKPDSSFEQVIEKPSVIRGKTDLASDELHTKRRTKKIDRKNASVDGGASKSAKSDETKKEQGKITLADTGEQSIKEAGSDARLTSFAEPVKSDSLFEQVIEKPSVIRGKIDQASDELQTKRKTKKMDKKKASVDDRASKAAKTDETKEKKKKITLVDTGEYGIEKVESDAVLTKFDQPVKAATSLERKLIKKPSVEQTPDEFQTKCNTRKKIAKTKVSSDDGASKSGKTYESKKKGRKITLEDTGDQSIGENPADVGLTSLDQPVKPDTSFEQVIKKPSVIGKKTEKVSDESQTKYKTNKKTDKKKASLYERASKSEKSETMNEEEKITLVDTGEQSIKEAEMNARLKPNTSLERQVIKKTLVDQAFGEFQTKYKTRKKIAKTKVSLDDEACKLGKLYETKRKERKINLVDTREQSIKDAEGDVSLASFDQSVESDTSFEQQIIKKVSVAPTYSEHVKPVKQKTKRPRVKKTSESEKQTVIRSISDTSESSSSSIMKELPKHTESELSRFARMFARLKARIITKVDSDLNSSVLFKLDTCERSSDSYEDENDYDNNYFFKKISRKDLVPITRSPKYFLNVKSLQEPYPTNTKRNMNYKIKHVPKRYIKRFLPYFLDLLKIREDKKKLPDAYKAFIIEKHLAEKQNKMQIKSGARPKFSSTWLKPTNYYNDQDNKNSFSGFRPFFKDINTTFYDRGGSSTIQYSPVLGSHTGLNRLVSNTCQPQNSFFIEKIDKIVFHQTSHNYFGEKSIRTSDTSSKYRIYHKNDGRYLDNDECIRSRHRTIKRRFNDNSAACSRDHRYYQDSDDSQQFSDLTWVETKKYHICNGCMECNMPDRLYGNKQRQDKPVKRNRCAKMEINTFISPGEMVHSHTRGHTYEEPEEVYNTAAQLRAIPRRAKRKSIFTRIANRIRHMMNRRKK